MTNKEKAAEIAHDLITHQVQDDWWYPRAEEHYKEALEKMGDWKDDELKSFIKDKYCLWKRSSIDGNDPMKIKISGLEEIYEDLFGEPLNMNYEQLKEHERDLYLTVEEIFGRHFMNEKEYEESINEFKKHLKVYEPD